MLWAPSLKGPRALKGPDLPGSLLFRAEDLFFFFFFFFFSFFFCLSIFFPQGRMQDLPNGGAPLQALAPGRWRPSLRHCVHELFAKPGTATKVQRIPLAISGATSDQPGCRLVSNNRISWGGATCACDALHGWCPLATSPWTMLSGIIQGHSECTPPGV